MRAASPAAVRSMTPGRRMRYDNAPMRFDCDGSTGYPSARLPVFARNVVATSHPLAAQAGLRMLRAGGNAVDAAIAGAAAMTLVEPCSNGLGSDAFCILWDGAAAARAERVGPRAGGLDAATTSCASTAPTPPTPPRRGWDSVTVPGAVSAWVALSRALRQAAVRRPARAGDRDRRARLCRAGGRRSRNGRWPPPCRPGVAARLRRRVPAARPRAAGRRAVPLRRRGAHLAGDRRDARRGVLPRRDRRGDRRACARARRRDDARPTSPRYQPEWVEPIGDRLSRPPAARDAAERAGHRGADGAAASPRTSTSHRCRSTASTRSTCRSRR